MIMFFDYIVYKYVCIYIYHTPMIVFMIIFLIMLMVLSIYVHLSYTLRSTLKIYGVYIYRMGSWFSAESTASSSPPRFGWRQKLADNAGYLTT